MGVGNTAPKETRQPSSNRLEEKMRLRAGGCRHQVGPRGLALLLALAVVLGGCASTQEGTGRGADRVAGQGETWTSGPAGPQSSGAVLSGFVVFGDFGGGKAQHAVVTAIERWVAAGHRVDALVTTGDNVYEDGDPRQFGAQLDQPYHQLRRTRPLWVTLGNHDVEGGHGPQQLDHLGLPALPYAKRLPGVELLFLDANRPDGPQGDWLDRRLGAPGPAFRVVVFHQPAYSCGTEHGSTRAVIRRWVPILERHRAVLVLNGHEHDYQRFTSGAGVTYVVTGGGGKSLYPILRSCPGVPARQAWAVRYHFVAVEVRRGSLSLTAIAEDGSVLDRAILTR
jgi:acid phosphatase